MNRVRHWPVVYFFALLMIAAVSFGEASATEPETAAPSYKFTSGYYRLSGQASGWDLNLRQTSNLGNLWVGYFNLKDQGVSEWRAGWDRVYGRDIRVTPSIQIASGGFVATSLQLEYGAPWFGSIGVGRTNLRPYFNLNFDPNDSYTLAFGKRSETNELMMVQYVRDNRENPDQRHVHFVYRRPIHAHERLSLDLLFKQGLVRGEMIHRVGLTVTYDWRYWFARVAWDPNTNFTPDNALRFSLGARF